ncbi:NADP-dependent malic enzyme [Sphingobium algorifonticola]|uniref:NADP-dependent malic enzyme n=1 Tax=Sphingobium algorifonticola TaxID=2008318 RepID=A0A437J5V6_9SPHN|nr:NADP-dependent malic enzyme [Sphingobium algorifonticola]RVT40286.1 NADP-dependent malic enzyme [Sphingobium algorifonticola]
MDDDFRRSALDYHRHPRPGKLAIEATKRMATQRDLALAYSPGVAAPCEEIAADPDKALDYTARGNLVAVISNGTAVLGLGNIGALAGKPVMEGKAVLFKKFADIDVFDLEIATEDPDKFVEAVALLEPTFGGINLEDIKAPECFAIEQRLRARMNIPVFHDDQHGTAIVVAAAVRNALLLQGKTLSEARLVTSGAGAAALACVDLLVSMGLRQDNVTLTDRDGVIYAGRQDDMLPNMARYARKTDARLLPDVLTGADIFLGLSAPRVLKPEWLAMMGPKPVIFALANPEPEILPDVAKAHRPDAIVATGRSDYPNQVNNVLCFPYIFRGALDAGATEINEAMKIAAAEAIADLARLPADESVRQAYGGAALHFGPDYIIPTPFDSRLILRIAPAVAEAAARTGVARRPIADIAGYARALERSSWRSGQLMLPVFDAARQSGARIAYAEGEDERVLRAIQTVLDEGLGKPVIVARRRIVEQRMDDLGLRWRLDSDVEIVDPEVPGGVLAAMVAPYQALVTRRGIAAAEAERNIYRRPAVTAAMLLRSGHVDAALVGGNSEWWSQVQLILPVIERQPGIHRVFALTALILPAGALFITDTHMVPNPSAEEIAEMTELAAAEIRRFGIEPQAALLSHSNFGASGTTSARKMRAALELLRSRSPDLAVDGEMHADAALSPALRNRLVLDSPLRDAANLLVMPTLDAANITLTTLHAATEALAVGPMLTGLSQPLHVLVPTVTSRGIVNLSAIAAAEARR